MLSFVESYDPNWVASVAGKEYKSMPLYGAINGFWIQMTGDLEITISYKPQDYFEIGYIISILSILMCISYIIYDLKKKKLIKFSFRKK
jgi:uncharacterized membrane protein YfhO